MATLQAVHRAALRLTRAIDDLERAAAWNRDFPSPASAKVVLQASETYLVASSEFADITGQPTLTAAQKRSRGLTTPTQLAKQDRALLADHFAD
jgi:hypothetical protein